MNSDWRNPTRPLDVNNDMYVSPLDALVVINSLNFRGASSDLGVRQNQLASYLDTNGDRNLSPLDALVVINELNRSDRSSDNASQRIDGEAETAPAGFVSIVMGGLPGNRDQIVALSSQLTIGREEFNEMGLFVVDGPNGAVNGVLPSSPSYSTEVFATANRRVLYSKRSVFRTAREATFPAGSTLGVYVLQETSDNGDADKHLRVRETGTSKVRIGWEEHFSPSAWIGVGDRGYDDVTIDMTIGQPFDGNAEPVITAIPNQFMNEETELSIQTLAMDADLPNDALRYSLDVAPNGATIDPTTGRFRWTPTEAQGPGNFEVIIRATDLEGAFDTEAFTVTVLEVNRPPVLQPIADKQLEIGKNHSFNTLAIDPDLPANTLTYSLLAGAPAGATIDSRTGVFNWLVPQNTASGGYPISVRVSDGGSPVLSDTKSFTVTVGSCIFGSQLEGWTVAQTGGSLARKGAVTASACSAVITEGDSFTTTLRTSFVVPSGATEVSFRVNNLNFDQNDPRFINDAFEVSVVDNQGRPLVAPYQPGRDAAWNITESLAESKSSSVTVDQDKIRLSLIGIPSGEQATLIFRLINNDSDRASSVVISDVTVPGFGTLSASPVIVERSGQSTTRSMTIAADPPIVPQVLAGNLNELILPSRPEDSVLSNLTTVSFTTPADFSSGSLFNTLIGASPDILNLNPPGETTLLPFIWIANSGEGSVSLFNTQTGKELGRYRTGPNSIGGGLSPSRIGVAGDGSAWVANRAPGLQGSVIKVMNDGFIDRNGNGIVDTSTDRNSNGVIDPDELMGWDANNDGQPDDEKISFSIPVGRNPANPEELRSNGVARAVAVDANDNVWVGIFNQRQYEVYDGKTGQFLTAVATPGTPYGALIDSQGMLWGATLDDNRIEKIDTQTRTLVKSYHTGTSNYGIAIDTDGVIWTSPYPGTEVTRLDPRTEEITRYNVGVQSGGGIMVDRQENIWFVGYNTDRMYKLTIGPDRKTIVSQTSLSVPGQPKAASIDADGFLWTTTLNDSRAYKIDTTTSTVVPGWPIATGLSPYNYSDMTGAIRQGITARRGTWTEIVDAQRENAKWAVARVIANTPPNTSVTIRLRASNSRQALENLPWVEVQSGAAIDNVVGRYLQTELLLQSASRDVQPTVLQLIVDAVPPPNLYIFRPFEEISRVGKRIIEGLAEAAQVGVQSGVFFPNSIESVTVNGQPVDVFDVSGCFGSPASGIYGLIANEV
ncbi:MAG: putative Ig domain-containing protein [Planctomycetota bacterium]|nr:putative Ig domain-containing protein [Planctomycetota bacterium]